MSPSLRAQFERLIPRQLLQRSTAFLVSSSLSPSSCLCLYFVRHRRHCLVEPQRYTTRFHLLSGPSLSPSDHHRDRNLTTYTLFNASHERSYGAENGCRLLLDFAHDSRSLALSLSPNRLATSQSRMLRKVASRGRCPEALSRTAARVCNFFSPRIANEVM